jgi:hypothetical protein
MGRARTFSLQVVERFAATGHLSLPASRWHGLEVRRNFYQRCLALSLPPPPPFHSSPISSSPIHVEAFRDEYVTYINQTITKRVYHTVDEDSIFLYREHL